MEAPPLVLEGKEVKSVKSFRYLGFILDTQLRWKEKSQRSVGNATKWLMQFRRLTRPSTGVSGRLMGQLYVAVAQPKMTYGLDIWYSPPHKEQDMVRSKGSVAVMKSFQKAQRAATLAITGALRTTPTEMLDAHAGILPMDLALRKICFRSTLRLLTLPDTHPLRNVVEKAKRAQVSSHAGPIDYLLDFCELKRGRH